VLTHLVAQSCTTQLPIFIFIFIIFLLYLHILIEVNWWVVKPLLSVLFNYINILSHFLHPLFEPPLPELTLLFMRNFKPLKRAVPYTSFACALNFKIIDERYRNEIRLKSDKILSTFREWHKAAWLPDIGIWFRELLVMTNDTRLTVCVTTWVKANRFEHKRATYFAKEIMWEVCSLSEHVPQRLLRACAGMRISLWLWRGWFWRLVLSV